MVNGKATIRVLDTIRQGYIGGGESHVISLVEHMDKRVFKPVVLSFTGGQMINSLQKMGVKSYVIPTLKAFDFFKWRSVKKLMREEHISLVHAHGTRAASNVYWAARSLKIPIIYTVHGWSFHDNQHPLIKKIRMVWKFLIRKMNMTILVSKSNQVTGDAYFKKFNSVVINNGIDLERFSKNNTYKNIRESLGISNNDLVIGFIARMTLQKQPLALIQAFSGLLKKVKGLKLLLVGEGELREEAEQLASLLQVNENIIFENFRQDIPEVLNAMDIYCLPSLWEGLPIGLLEAMAMGKAVIATKVDGSREIVENEKNGLLIEPGNVTALSDALIRLCVDEELRNTLGNNAGITIHERYNVFRMTRSIENVYKKALSEQPAKYRAQQLQ